MGAPQDFVNLVDLVKIYETGFSRVEVLGGINLSIARGETLAVVGASGVGKSTLLHMIGTLDRPTSGQVYLDGARLDHQDEKALARMRNHRIGFVFQFHHLLSEFNALENAAMPAMIAGQARREALESAGAILERVGLKERLRHRIGELSGGEQQRVAVARALIMSPDLLLADEPTGNLDSRTGQRINELLCELNTERGLTSVVVTHNLDLARMMSRRIRLVEGQTIEEK